MLVGARLTDRFAVERRLGSGAMGVVYEALDEQRGERVALKTLDRVDGTAIYRLKKEFRSLADLVHPNLVRLHELFSDGDLWFFTMERIYGVSFIEHVRGESHVATVGNALSEMPTLPQVSTMSPRDIETRLRRALAQLAGGVRAIHASGKLHRDLKPSNVLVSVEGRLTILDFGLVEPATPDSNRTGDSGAGTPAFMAPEQLQGHPCPASDWYAVGGMIFQALAGRLPFTGTVHDVMAAKLSNLPPPDPREFCATAPKDLADLSRALLEPRPADRPDPKDIMAALAAGADQLVTILAPLPTARARATFVGREPELRRLREALDAVQRGEPRIVAVGGLSGIGKTALVERFLDEVRTKLAPEALIITGRCYERESVPFKAVDAVVDGLSRYLMQMDPVAAALLTPRGVPELCRVFPVLARVPTLARVAPGRAAVDPDEIRRRGFQALRELFARIADTRPVVIAVDDLQWGDVDSGLLITRLVAPPEPPRMLLIGAYRSDEIQGSGLMALLTDFARRDGRGRVETVTLEPLGEDSAIELATKLVEEGDAPDRIELASAIATESGGSPFFIAELARATINAKAPSLAHVITDRVAALLPAERTMLEVVAIAAGPVPRDAALAAAGLETTDDAAIGVLRAASFLRSSRTGNDEKLETYHDRIRESVVATLDPERRRTLHSALADALASSGSPPVESLALHYREAGRNADALKFGILAADRAAESLAFDRAARLYGETLELVPAEDTHGRRSLERKLADMLADAGKGREAAEVYLRAAADARGDDVVELERRAAYALLYCGDLDRGLEVTRAVSMRVGLWMPREPWVAWLLGSIMLVYFYIRGASADPKEAKHNNAARRRRLEVTQSLAVTLALTETTRTLYLCGASALGAVAMGDPVLIATALANACWGIAYVRPRDGRIQRRLETLRELALKHDHPKLGPLEALGAGVVAFFQGRASLAHAVLERAEEGFARCSEAYAELNMARAVRTWSIYYLGQMRTFSKRVPALAAEARARGDLVGLTTVVCNFGPCAWLSQDDVETAMHQSDEAFAPFQAKRFQIQRLWHLLARGLIDLYAGDPERAYQRNEREWPALRRSGALFGQINVQLWLWNRAGAALATAAEDARSRAALLAKAESQAKKLAKTPVFGSVPMSSALRAGIARVRGDQESAAELLGEAIHAFEDLEMRAFAAATRRQLGLLRGGDEGKMLVAAADSFMTREGIVKPERFSAMLAPGFGALRKP